MQTVFILASLSLLSGSIPHLMIAELFLQSSRASAYSVGGFVQWFCVFFIGFTYILIEVSDFCGLVWVGSVVIVWQGGS